MQKTKSFIPGPISPQMASVQNTLGARNFSLLARNSARRHLNRHRQRLKCTFSFVMIILPANIINMQCHASALGKALQAVWNHLSAEIADLFSFQGHVDDGVWTIGEVNDSTGEGFV